MEIPQSPRAVSPVVSTILLVATVVILGTTISVLALGVTDDLNDAGPVVGQSTAEFIGDRSGADDQIVRITHIAGDSVAVSEMEIVVRACEKTTSLINLPAPTTRTASTPTYFPFDEGNFQGNQDLLSEGTVGQSWDAGALHEDTTNTFAAGSSFEFRITNGACSLAAGETIEVMVVHSPTNSVMIDTELTAQ